MSKYPEHDKIDKAKAETVREVLNFIEDEGLQIGRFRAGENDFGNRFDEMSHKDLFAQFFGTKESVLEQERIRMLGEMDQPRFEDLKKIPLQFASMFPIKHPKAGEQTGFKDAIISGRKIHTIRKGLDEWIRKADLINEGTHILDTRIWSGYPYRSTMDIDGMPNFSTITVEPVYMTPDGSSIQVMDSYGNDIDIELLAKNDGLSVDDFASWFRANKGKDWRWDQDTGLGAPFAVIHWTPLYYANL